MPESQMTFQRFGRSYHLRIDSAEDLAMALDLDEARWVATGVPTATLNCDATLLGLLDGDSDGRILCSDMKRAVRWTLDGLRDRDGITAASDTLSLDAINMDDPEGERIYASARKVLAGLGEPDAEQITLAQVRQIKATVAGASVSEAGVVLPDAHADDDIRRFLADIIATVGGAEHPSGSPGVGKAQLDAFVAQARAWLDWSAQALPPTGGGDCPVMPLGERTAEAFALYSSLRGKIDQYFAQCDAVSLDPRAAEHVAPSVEELGALDLDDPKAIDDFIRKSPLAIPRADGALDLGGRLNQSYADKLARLRGEVLETVLGGPVESLSQDQWSRVKAFFAAHEAWATGAPDQTVAVLGADVLGEYLDERFGLAVDKLIAESAETAFVLDNIRLTEKLILYQANLLALANNFVSFPHLYDPDCRAMFEMGTLVMDGRRFQMSIRVTDRKRHAAIAKTGNMYVLYVQITDPGEGGNYEVAVPVTSGGKGNLCVGKRGIFQDVAGRELDARVVQIIENPISVVEALISPFQRLAKMLSGKIESITATAEKQFDTVAAGVVDKVDAPRPAAKPAGPSKGMLAGGLLMGGGVALAAVASALAYVTKTLADVKWWHILLGVGGVILAVMLPVAVVALIKLRRRDLSAIMEGSGWAINARMRLTMRQGRFFTSRPRLPKGCRRTWGR